MTMERVERIYSSYSGIYDLLFDTILKPGRQRAVEAMALAPGSSVLEVGVGTGLSLPYYPDGCHVTGVDISGGMLDKANDKLRRMGARRSRQFDLRLMPAERLDMPDATYDRVLLSYVISCVERPDPIVREVRRVVRPGGRVLFLNHFARPGRVLSWGERRLTPLTRKLGFVLDMPIDVITRTRLFEIERVERVNLFGLWTLAVCVPR